MRAAGLGEDRQWAASSAGTGRWPRQPVEIRHFL